MKYLSKGRINVRTIRKIEEGQGLTLRRGRIVEYKTGWQVATCGITCKTPEEVAAIIRSPLFRDYCGIWLEKGVYYLDYSRRAATKKEAVAVGAANKQISIYSWGRTKMDRVLYI